MATFVISILSLFLDFISEHTWSMSKCVSVCICVCMRVCVFPWAQEITEEARTESESRSPAHRGKNSFLESYISTGICLMSARVERCIEHVRRPLAMRCG